MALDRPLFQSQMIGRSVEQDLQLKDGKVEAYRAKVKLSFKYEGEG
jgi:flavin-binding protein dodecin